MGVGELLWLRFKQCPLALCRGRFASGCTALANGHSGIRTFFVSWIGFRNCLHLQQPDNDMHRPMLVIMASNNGFFLKNVPTP